MQNNPFYKDEIKELSKVADPIEWFFELTKEQSEFYDRVIKDYFGDPDEGGYFKGAIYRPFEYKIEKKKLAGEKFTEKESFQYVQQRNLYDFMRRLLVKRFESSFGSFKQSIENFKKITTDALTFIEKTHKYILDRSLLEKIYELDIDEIEKHLEEYARKIKNGEYPKNHEVYEVDKFKNKEQFIADIKADIALFDRILNELNQMNLVDNDPKAECLLRNLKKVLTQTPPKGEPKRKVVIFSEYLDTVRYLEPILQKNFNDRVLIIKDNLTSSKIDEINKNFDASYEEQEDKYDILLGTDRISEGLNLNRAGMVINYDIPWNPVRVIQRVGRINRISKKVFNELYIVNFFPTEQGAELVKSREIASNKMFLIHNTLGEEAKIFDIEEEPTPSGLYERIQTNPDYLEEESFYTKALRLYIEIKGKYPELVKNIDNYPTRIKVAKKSSDNELLVFFKKGRLYIRAFNYDEDQLWHPTFEEVFERIKCEKDEPLLQLSSLFWDKYEQIKNLKESRTQPSTEQSIETKALTNIKTLLQKPWDDLLPFLNFLRTLREDILDYGTLPDYTLRRIANLPTIDEKEESRKKLITELSSLRDTLGEDYLEREKQKLTGLAKEIIIAIENQRGFDA
ncbi:helicase-related protein [Thermodesulfovibrio hydrogeniphilus]